MRRLMAAAIAVGTMGILWAPSAQAQGAGAARRRAARIAARDAAAVRTAAVLPWTITGGGDGAGAEVLAQVADHIRRSGYPRVRVAQCADTWFRRIECETTEADSPAPGARSMGAQARSVGVDCVVTGRVRWRHTTVREGDFATTKVECVVDALVVGARGDRVLLNARDVAFAGDAVGPEVDALAAAIGGPVPPVPSASDIPALERRAALLAIARVMRPLTGIR